MTKLKLAAVEDDKPVRLTLTLPAALHRDLVAYAEIMSREAGTAVEPAKLIAPMLEKFIASDRGFRKMRAQDSKLVTMPSEQLSTSSSATSSAPS